MTDARPLAHLRAWECADAPGVAFAGRLLALAGVRVEVFEPPGGSALRRLPPFVGERSALFDHLTAGKTLRAAGEADDADDVNLLLVGRDGLPAASEEALAGAELPAAGRAVLTCTPYGTTGPKAGWQDSELTLFQAGGEGFLMPSGLSWEQFPDRPPVGAGRNVGSYQGGMTLALVALAALRLSRVTGATERAEVAIQEAQLSLNNLVVSRYVDGVLECRANRGFAYGGILPCRDGHVELVPIEQHQWDAVRAMLGSPAWADDERFQEGMSRGRLGAEINAHLRAWAAERTTEEVMVAAKEHDVPCGRFIAPEELPDSPQLAGRGFFAPAPDGMDYVDVVPGAPWAIEG